jgi:hypothetical protein
MTPRRTGMGGNVSELWSKKLSHTKRNLKYYFSMTCSFFLFQKMGSQWYPGCGTQTSQLLFTTQGKTTRLEWGSHDDDPGRIRCTSSQLHFFGKCLVGQKCLYAISTESTTTHMFFSMLCPFAPLWCKSKKKKGCVILWWPCHLH